MRVLRKVMEDGEGNMTKEKIRWLYRGLEEISDDMLMSFNCSRKELLKILGYCRKNVEEYYYAAHLQSKANSHKI